MFIPIGIRWRIETENGWKWNPKKLWRFVSVTFLDPNLAHHLRIWRARCLGVYQSHSPEKKNAATDSESESYLDQIQVCHIAPVGNSWTQMPLRLLMVTDTEEKRHSGHSFSSSFTGRTVDDLKSYLKNQLTKKSTSTSMWASNGAPSSWLCPLFTGQMVVLLGWYPSCLTPPRSPS